MSHEPARKEENGRGRNENESVKHDSDILWKTLTKSIERRCWMPFIDQKP
jgi:hypothetical protein